jgi:hypothetical protein
MCLLHFESSFTMKNLSLFLTVLFVFASVDIRNPLFVKAGNVRHPADDDIISKHFVRPHDLSARNRSVAICFCGQFLRHAKMHQSITEKFGSIGMLYDAFVASSTQHVEEDKNDTVSDSELCTHLLEQGFRRCITDLVPYDIFFWINSTREFPLRFENGLYAYRIASYFSTISRCLEQIRMTELEFGEHLRQAGQSHFHHFQTPADPVKYDKIFVTRLDTVNLVSATHAAAEWWDHLNDFDIICSRKSVNVIDDRFFGGARDAMLPLAGLTDYFLASRGTLLGTYPERELFQFFASQEFRAALGRTPRIKLGPDFVRINGFKRNTRKYEEGFQEYLLQALHRERDDRAASGDGPPRPLPLPPPPLPPPPLRPV